MTKYYFPVVTRFAISLKNATTFLNTGTPQSGFTRSLDTGERITLFKTAGDAVKATLLVEPKHPMHDGIQILEVELSDNQTFPIQEERAYHSTPTTREILGVLLHNPDEHGLENVRGLFSPLKLQCTRVSPKHLRVSNILKWECNRGILDGSEPAALTPGIIHRYQP